MDNHSIEVKSQTQKQFYQQKNLPVVNLELKSTTSLINHKDKRRQQFTLNLQQELI